MEKLLQSMFTQTNVILLTNYLLLVFFYLRILKYTKYLKHMLNHSTIQFRSNKIHWYIVMVYKSYLEMKTTCEFDINNTAYKYSTLRKLYFVVNIAFRKLSAMYYIHAIAPPPPPKKKCQNSLWSNKYQFLFRGRVQNCQFVMCVGNKQISKFTL